MKTIIRILIFLFALSLCGCKTKERVTERLTETARAASSSVAMTSQHTEREGLTSTMEEATRTSWSDSIVERFHERVVVDSCGRVLLHEKEHTRDRYKGRTRSQSRRDGSIKETSSGQEAGLELCRNDSTYHGGTLNEVTVVRKRSWRWVWFLWLLGSLLAAGIIISIMTRR